LDRRAEGLFDETWFIQRFTLRLKRSVWWKIKVEKVAVLEGGASGQRGARRDGHGRRALGGGR